MYRRASRRERVYRVRGGLDLKGLYHAYYSLRPPIGEPPRIQHREFAFQYFDSDTYHRHLSFDSIDAVLDHMIERPPRQAYYSVSLYELPEAKSMEEKGWMEAPLFFDIDVDHYDGCGSPVPTDDCLLRGLEDAYRIVMIARRDLGAGEARVYYTGHRGFHVIVECPGCERLGRDERREIARYIAALDFEPSIVFPARPPRGFEPAAPTPGDPGWRGWIAGGLEDSHPSLVRALGRRWVDEVYRIVEGLRVDIDLQVTQDPTRLTRLPGTLNGKASLLAVPVSRGWRPDYRLLSPFQGEVVAECRGDIEARTLGYPLACRRGEEATLPAQIGVMLDTKGLARVVGGEVVVRAYTGWWRL